MESRRRALVTGASSGIGLEFARALSSDHDLILVARRREKLQEVAEELRTASGAEVDVVSKDLSDRNAVATLADEVGEREVDLLVNNAGFGIFDRFEDQDRDRVLAMIDLNIGAVTDLCHQFLPGMLERGRGSIINVASVQGFMGVPYFAVYAATKAYIVSFSEALAVELEPKGIHVMALCPGTTKTKFQASAGAGSASRMPGPAMTPAEVVEAAIESLRKEEVTVVPGVSNKLSVFASRIAPPLSAARMMGSMLRDEVEENGST